MPKSCSRDVLAFSSENRASTPAVINTSPPVIAVRSASLTALMFRALTPPAHGSAPRSAPRYLTLMQLRRIQPITPISRNEPSAGSPTGAQQITPARRSVKFAAVTPRYASRPLWPPWTTLRRLDIGAGPESQFRTERQVLIVQPTAPRLDGATDSSPNAAGGRVQTTPLSY